MKEQFTLKLSNTHQRPIIQLEQFNGSYALIDTGALMPVWVEGDRAFLSHKAAQGAVLIQEGVEFGGFGAGKDSGNLYKIPYLQIGKLIYPNFPVIVCKKDDYPFSMVLSDPMFEHLIITRNGKSGTFTVEVPDDESCVRNLIIEYNNDKWYVFCSSAEKMTEISDKTDSKSNTNPLTFKGLSF